jgi:recombination protein RecR
LEKFSSKLLQAAVDEFTKLPGIGKKTALRLVLHLLKQPAEDVEAFAGAFTNVRNNIVYCKKCHNISDREICDICESTFRDQSLVCVVEDLRDVIAIENTGQYRGVYHVLGGLISPMEGVGPDDLFIESLLERIEADNIREIIFALSANMEGDTTTFYIYRKLQNHEVTLSTIARGIAIGDELEYADEVTLGRSIINRTPYHTTIPNPKR